MVIHPLQTIFIHIPKTAGVSITHAILSQLLHKKTKGSVNDLPANIQNQYCLTYNQKHEQGKHYVSRIVSQEIWDQYYKFAFVRNPWDRMVSEFSWRRTKPAGKYFNTFEEFVQFFKQVIEEGHQKKDIWSHAQPQTSFICRNNQTIVNDIFLFENLSEALQTISDRLGLKLISKRYNASKRNHYHEYYNNKTKRLVGAIYKTDVEMFGYEF